MSSGCWRLRTWVPSLRRNLSSNPILSKKTKAVLPLPGSKIAELSKSAHEVCDLLRLPPMQLFAERKTPFAYFHLYHPSLRTWSRKMKLAFCVCCQDAAIHGRKILIPFCWVRIQSYLLIRKRKCQIFLLPVSCVWASEGYQSCFWPSIPPFQGMFHINQH